MKTPHMSTLRKDLKRITENETMDDHMVVLPVISKVTIYSNDEKNEHGIEISLFDSDKLTQTLPCKTREAAETMYQQIFALSTDEYNDNQKISMVKRLFNRMKLI